MFNFNLALDLFYIIKPSKEANQDQASGQICRHAGDNKQTSKQANIQTNPQTEGLTNKNQNQYQIFRQYDYSI